MSGQEEEPQPSLASLFRSLITGVRARKIAAVKTGSAGEPPRVGCSSVICCSCVGPIPLAAPPAPPPAASGRRFIRKSLSIKYRVKGLFLLGGGGCGVQ